QGAMPRIAAAAPLALMPSSALLADLPASPSVGLREPQLLSKVDPELPHRLGRRGGDAFEVVVDLTISADGSVADAAVRSLRDSDVAQAVVDAVRRWRYDAQPAARPHVVKLVITPS